MMLTDFVRISHDRIQSLQQFRTISDFILAAIVTTATELVISWNNISGVNNLDTAAQLIPPIISAAYFLRSIYVWMSEAPPDDESYDVDVSYWDGADRAPTPSHTIYEDPSYDWASRNRQPRRHRRHRRSTHVGYGVGQPEMSTAYGRHAAVVDALDQEHATGNIVEPEPVHENA